jgi:hypothetical protein
MAPACAQEALRRGALCTEATAIFVMAPSYLHRVAREYGDDLAHKAFLFADPFTKPVSLGRGEYTFADRSFDNRRAAIHAAVEQRYTHSA